MKNYVSIIKRLNKLQHACDHLRRMGRRDDAESLRLSLIAKMGALRALIDDYVNKPGAVNNRIQVETAMRLMGVSRRAMGWK